MTFKELEEKYKRSFEGLWKDLENGLWEKDACRLNGIAISTHHLWKKEFPEYRDKVELSILKYKKSLIIGVTANSFKSGKTGLEVLRRRWPKEWNVATKNQIEDPQGEIGKVFAVLLGKVKVKDIPKEEEPQINEINKEEESNDNPSGVPEVSGTN